MPEFRRINTGAGAYAERGSVPHNANRRRYGDPPQVDDPARGIRRDAASVAQVFASARHHVDALAPSVPGTGTLRESISRLESETARGDTADATVVARSLHTIADLAPALAAAIAAGLADPSAGTATVVRAAAAQATGRFGGQQPAR